MMSHAEANRFWERVKVDEDFRKSLASAGDDRELGALIRDAGFSVTAEDLQISIDAWTAGPSVGRELSDADLEAVAGGSVGGIGGGTLMFDTFRTGLTQLGSLTLSTTLSAGYKG